jgi:hypothetical protein
MTTTFKLSHVLRLALATALVFSAQIASAQALSPDVGAGSVVRLNWSSLGAQADGNGVYSGSVFSGPGAGSSFASFCLERNETFGLNTDTFVKSVTTTTTTNDPLSAQTAWLFTQYSINAAGYTITNNAQNLSMQQAFWSLENENGYSYSQINTQAKTWVTAANFAVSSNSWSGLGNVRVLNLYEDVGYTKSAQDQLVMLAPVPEPETYAMLLAGLGVMGAVVRRRKQKQAA